jgi:hypothetical protein
MKCTETGHWRFSPLCPVNCFKLAISNTTIVRIFQLVYDGVNDNGICTYEINSSESKLK